MILIIFNKNIQIAKLDCKNSIITLGELKKLKELTGFTFKFSYKRGW